jgi:hypothetical protein
MYLEEHYQQGGETIYYYLLGQLASLQQGDSTTDAFYL